MTEPFSKRKVFFISDPSHAFKKIVNSMINVLHRIKMKIHGESESSAEWYEVSLKLILDLWQALNNGITPNLFDFELQDFVKSKMSQMNVGRCIKVISRKVIEMINYAIVVWEEHKTKGTILPTSPLYNADVKYKGYKKFAEMFYQLWTIVNSKVKAMKRGSEDHKWMKEEFIPWFQHWQEECRIEGERDLTSKNIPITEQELSNYFFTTAACKDLLNMVNSMYELVEHYGSEYDGNEGDDQVLFLLGVITSDVNEHSFARIRKLIGANKVSSTSVAQASKTDHITKLVANPTSQCKSSQKRNVSESDNFSYSYNMNVVDLRDLNKTRTALKTNVESIKSSLVWSDEDGLFTIPAVDESDSD